MRAWFDQLVEEQMYWDIQGGLVDLRCIDNFLFLMQGFKQSLLPRALEVSIVSETKVYASLPGMNYKSPSGFMQMMATDDLIEFTVMHPNLRKGQGQTWSYQMNHMWRHRDLPWIKWNADLENFVF